MRLCDRGFELYTRWPFGAAEARHRQTATATALGCRAEQTVDLGPGARLVLVLIPAGQFQMGSPPGEKGHCAREALRSATVAKPFWIAKYPVTQDQWTALLGDNPSRIQEPRYPVHSVSWDDAQRFLRALNVQVSGATFALPTEQQWEYACRAGTDTPFHFGATLPRDLAHSLPTAPSDGAQSDAPAPHPRPVGGLPGNAWGLHDMHGNVWEWCATWYTDGPEAGGSPRDTGPGGLRVLRGGPTVSAPCAARSAARGAADPADAGDLFGLRVIRRI